MSKDEEIKALKLELKVKDKEIKEYKPIVAGALSNLSENVELKCSIVKLQARNELLEKVVEAARNYTKAFQSGSSALVWQEMDELKESLKELK